MRSRVAFAEKPFDFLDELVGPEGARPAALVDDVQARVALPEGHAEHRDALSVDHLVALFERHGVTVDVQGARSFGRPIGEVLLAKARELHCDFLVMGGYGHSPLREHLFGGVTYFVLEHMDLLVLLSH